MNSSALLSARILASATSGDHTWIGPFVATLDEASSSPARNYAIPANGAAPTPDDVAALVAFFTANNRLPRLEWIPSAAPRVEAVLSAAGFEVDDRLPQMAATAGTPLTPRRPDGLVLTLVEDDASLPTVATIQHRAYGESRPPGSSDVERLKRCRARGGLIAAARDAVTGEMICAGLIDVTGPDDPIGELAAVATAEAHRRRGIAGTLSAYLAEAAFERGMTMLFLECEAANRGVYSHTGFVECGERLWMSLHAADTGAAHAATDR
jgi:ribosomal protein S18 acetylase RimI-like enzyme